MDNIFQSKKIYLYLLFFIVFLGSFLRLWNLGFNPASLNWDEVAWGYNAYSLGIDGKDEFGKFLPYQYLESFGDFKPPLYAYLTILPVIIGGLSEYTTRLPSAIFGSLSVLLTYFLVKRIFYESPNDRIYALFSALFLAISPWHINLSRAAFEANVATCLLIVGVWAFLAGVQNKRWYLSISATCFALSFYTFNTPRIVVPILIIVLALGFSKKLMNRWRYVLCAAIIGAVILLPLLPFLFSPQASLRFKEVNIFTDITIIKEANVQIAQDGNNTWAHLLHNRRVAFVSEYLKHYFDHFNPEFLFIRGDNNPKFSTYDVGQMYIWDIPFFLAGILFLFRRREGQWWIIPVWLLIGIIPAATARETPHALRIETSLPTFQILTAVGFTAFLQWIQKMEFKKRYMNKSILAICGLLLVLQVGYYVYGYHFYYRTESAGDWNYGYKQSIQYVQSVQKNYQKIYVTDKLGRPYMYYLFYLHIDPEYFRQHSEIKRDTFGFVHVNRIGKYTFGSEANFPKQKNALYISDPKALPLGAVLQKNFDLLNGVTVLTAYTL